MRHGQAAEDALSAPLVLDKQEDAVLGAEDLLEALALGELHDAFSAFCAVRPQTLRAPTTPQTTSLNQQVLQRSASFRLAEWKKSVAT
jgi:hypothetical protein